MNDTKTPYLLRKAQLQDRNYILNAEQETAAISFEREQTPEEIENRTKRLELALQTESILVAEWKGQILGYCWIEGLNHRACLIVDFYVDAAYRGIGIGDWLFKAAASACEQSGVKILKMAISDRNTRSVRFFARRGAVCLDPIPVNGFRDYEVRLEGDA